MSIARLADEIASAGLKHVFGIPGSGSTLSLIDALSRRGVNFRTTHFEGTAAIMAGTLGRLTEIPGVAVAIKGPGLANMVPGLAACCLEGFPMVAVAEAYAAEQPTNTVHKWLDHKGLVMAVSKGIRSLSEDGPSYRAMARWAATEPPGPVVFQLAPKPPKSELPPPFEPETSSRDRAGLELVERAKRPVVVAGALALRRGWGPELAALNVPVFTTASAKGLIDERLKHAAGVYTGVGLELVPEATILSAADLVVGLGLRANELLNYGRFPCSSIGVDDIPAACSKIPFDHRLEPNSVQLVFESLRARSWGLEELSRHRAALKRRFDAEPFLPGPACAAIQNRFGSNVRLVVDTGYFCTIAEHAWQATGPNTYLGSGSGRDMGVGLPMALAAALVDSTVPTVLLIGDGGIGMYWADIEIAVSARLPIAIILMSDGGFGSIRVRAIRDGLDQRSLLFPHRDWLRYAEGFGLPTRHVTSHESFSRALHSWKATEPLFVRADFDPNAYQTMVTGIR